MAPVSHVTVSACHTSKSMSSSPLVSVSVSVCHDAAGEKLSSLGSAIARNRSNNLETVYQEIRMQMRKQDAQRRAPRPSVRAKVEHMQPIPKLIWRAGDCAIAVVHGR